MEEISPNPAPASRAFAWPTSPDQLGELDSLVVRYIAADLSEAEFERAQRRVMVDLRRRVERLLAKHLQTQSLPALESLPRAAREELAMRVLDGELDDIETSPGQLAPLRTVER